MTTWWERLDRATRERGWSRAELSRVSGVPHSNVRKYLTGKVDKPRGDTLPLLCAALEVSEQWVLFGGEQEASETLPPIIALSAFGGPMGIAELKEKLAVEARFRVIAPDAAMAPVIPSGAEATCDAGAVIQPNNIVLALVEGEPSAIIRRYREVRIKNGITEIALTADHPGYPDYALNKGEGYTIIARVTHVTTAV